MALDFYRALRAFYSESSITLVIPETIQKLEIGVSFDRVEYLSRDDRQFPFGIWKKGRALSQEKYDLGICLPSSWSAALLLYSASIPTRVGFFSGGSDLLLTAGLPWLGPRIGKHKSQLYQDLIHYLGAPHTVIPRVETSNPSVRSGIVLAPGASTPLREWPYFIELTRGIIQYFPEETITFVGSQKDEKWTSQIRRIFNKRVRNEIGKTDLGELTSICKNAKLVIANDSGVAHVAAALCQTAVIILYGPGSPEYIKPEGSTIALFAPHVLCRPCNRSRCAEPYGYQRCLREIKVAEVLTQVRKVLSPLTIESPGLHFSVCS